jgi:hypothetical protein
MLAGAGVVAAAVAAVVRDPALAPSYEHMFFTSHIAVIPVVLALGQFPLLLLHEAFHALAARRLGLSSTLGVGRRFTYLVAETRLDALYSVPRRQRYLPFLAGAWVDLVGTGVLTLLAAAARHENQPRWLSELLLACSGSPGSACSTWRRTSTSSSTPPPGARTCTAPRAPGSRPACVACYDVRHLRTSTTTSATVTSPSPGGSSPSWCSGTACRSSPW